ncbi:MAG TPA: hypothetical protein PLE45_06775 [Spirochaetota bacterium]|nr:hypothetical protein [Spirochaetota bacterium]HOL56919.1 hypothetical protein [Spirochaetota bacterium]HPP04614.1 hypothetical protein [Spirochaetota bacterium]
MNHKEMKKNDDSELIKAASRSLELLKNGTLIEAQNSFEELLKSHFNNDIAESGLKACKYWQTRINKLDSIKENIAKGKFLLNEWKKFENFIEGTRFNKKVLASIIYFVHKKALDFLKKDLAENRIIDAELIYLTGIANKKIGDYKNAIVCFEKAINIDINNANIIAQLADSYALIDEDEKAKLLFREAFFIEPDIIDIDSLDSNIIHTIISKLYEFHISEKDIKSWIPIYGRVLGLFNVYRELMPVEYGRLKQEIFYLEKEINVESDYMNSKRARLINCYLWLYDYFLIKGNSEKELLQIEDNIKSLSQDIYNLLKNKQEIK